MFISPAYAQAASSAPGGPAAFLIQVAPIALIFAIFYFLLIRPQQQQMKRQRAKIDAVKKGDSVVTGGGLIAKVIKVDDTTAEVEIAPNVRVKAVKSSLTEVTPAGSTKAAND